MAARHVFVFTLGFASFSAPLALTSSSAALAQATEQAVPAVPNSSFEFIGRVNTNTIPVQSGPGKGGFYPTQNLKKGDELHIVGIKGNWLKIMPPKGSFSYVPKAYVTRRNDGMVGRVDSELNVRTGSSVNEMKSTIQLKLEPNQDVKILGEHQEYYKIEPPDGAYVFVEKKYVDLVDRVPGEKPAEKPAEKLEVAEAPTEPVPDAPAAPADTETAPGEGPVVTNTPEPGTPGAAPAPADGAPAGTQPAKPEAVAAVEDFRKVEADYEAASKQPVIDQPIEKLAERYQALAKSGTLTGTTKRIVDARLLALKMRADARDQLVAFRKSQDDVKERQQALLAENEEIKQRVAETQVAIYAAVGTLRVSSLQQGNTTLYRLTDPSSGRTIVYIRSNEPEYAKLINQFVGVKGDLSTDERMKMRVITPTAAEPVDPSKVNTTIIATITPPSMILSTSASVDPNEPGN